MKVILADELPDAQADERGAFETWWLSDVPEEHRAFAKKLLDSCVLGHQSVLVVRLSVDTSSRKFILAMDRKVRKAWTKLSTQQSSTASGRGSNGIHT